MYLWFQLRVWSCDVTASPLHQIAPKTAPKTPCIDASGLGFDLDFQTRLENEVDSKTSEKPFQNLNSYNILPRWILHNFINLNFETSLRRRHKSRNRQSRRQPLVSPQVLSLSAVSDDACQLGPGLRAQGGASRSLDGLLGDIFRDVNYSAFNPQYIINPTTQLHFSEST